MSDGIGIQNASMTGFWTMLGLIVFFGWLFDWLNDRSYRAKHNGKRLGEPLTPEEAQRDLEEWKREHYWDDKPGA